jgi:hypothetical protein
MHHGRPHRKQACKTGHGEKMENQVMLVLDNHIKIKRLGGGGGDLQKRSSYNRGIAKCRSDEREREKKKKKKKERNQFVQVNEMLQSLLNRSENEKM